jgi:uncharacterized membrane protein YdjX (TVP38/TMEM64 family)
MEDTPSPVPRKAVPKPDLPISNPVLRWIGIALLLFAAILVPFLMFEGAIERFAIGALEALRGNPFAAGGLIVASLALDPVLPIPSSLVSAAAGGVFGLWGGALAVWIGMMAGAVLGHLLGVRAGRALGLKLVGDAEMARAGRLFQRIGPVLLMITRGVPVLAESAVIAAGAAGMPMRHFLLPICLGNLAVALAYGWLGATAISADSFLLLFAGLAALPALGWAAWARHSSTRN